MLPIRKTALRELDTLHREMDHMFSRLFGRNERWVPPLWDAEEYFPPLDYMRKGENLVVRAALPGIDPKDVDIAVTGNQLRIRGERKEEQTVREDDFYMHEISSGDFERTVTLPEGVNTEEIQASYRDGVLEITMPAREVPKAKKVVIKTEKEPKQVKSA